MFGKNIDHRTYNVYKKEFLQNENKKVADSTNNG